MRWTIRRRLDAIIALTAATMLLMTIVDVVGVRVVDRYLDRIQRGYLPQLALATRADAAFVALVRSLQESVAAQDLERLASTAEQKQHLLSMLETAPRGVDKAELRRAVALIDEWYAYALPVARRLLVNETGEALVADVERMQALQRTANESLSGALALDRTQMERAFAEVSHAGHVTWLIRMITWVALAIGMLLLGATLGRSLFGRIRALEQGFERFGRGDFTHPVPLAGDDELTEVTVHANRMAANLLRLNDEVRRGQAELERTNRELEAFSYSVSHDLRAPLRSIDGFSKALLEDFAHVIPPEGQHYLHRVRAASQRMAQLIDDMLKLSRIGRADLQRAEVDLSALVRTVVQTLNEAPGARPVEVQVEEGLSAQADARLLTVVFENLLSNAYKFTSKVSEPRIEVGSAGSSQEGPVFFVRDNGVGFDEAYMGKLFTPFHRLHAEKDFPGTGVGLATVQRVVHRHGGRVWAKGEVNQGATFFFSLGGVK